jgi:hypothetical protein
MKENKEFTYEMLMEAFRELAEDRKKESEDRKKASEEAQKEMAELRARQEKTDKMIDKLSKNIGGIDRSNGLMAEEAVYNSLSKNNVFANIKFDYIRKNIQLQSEDHRTLAELDILMINGDTIAIIETKYKVEKKDIYKMLRSKLQYFREVFPKYNNHKIVLGIGGMSFDKGVEDIAKENGVGIIKIVGDKVEYYTEGIKIY